MTAFVKRNKNEYFLCAVLVALELEKTIQNKEVHSRIKP